MTAGQSFSALLPDMRSGFIIFLLALPLSLGIAKASDFPPMMGLLTAIIGGLVVSPLMGAPLTIKGPAAGLIVIVAGAVADFGGGEAGWRLALGAMVGSGYALVNAWSSVLPLTHSVTRELEAMAEPQP